MRGGLVACWKALTSFKTIEYTKKSYGNARFINAGMLGEMLESMEILRNRLNYKKDNKQKVKLIKAGMLGEVLKNNTIL